MFWQQVAPVIVSILVIIAIAVLRHYSTSVASITATMPLNVTLALWIVYAAEGGQREVVTTFSRSLFIYIWPTVLFLLAAWLALRAGWTIVPVLAAGYTAWLIGLGLVFGVGRLVGG